MKFSRFSITFGLCLALAACDGGASNGDEGQGTSASCGDEVMPSPLDPTYASCVGTSFLATHSETRLIGASDNAEVIRVLPGSNKLLLLASKARKLTLLDVQDGALSTVAEKVFFAEDSSESELTSLSVSPDGTWAVATRTIIEKDDSGRQVDCAGELVFFDLSEGESFGAILKQIEVGPMPDAVAISGDGRFVVSADERDGPDAWGKCEVAGEKPSISVIEIGEGPDTARLRSQIALDEDIAVSGPREPEYVAISRDNDRVVVTLQDSHEIAVFDISALPEGVSTSDSLPLKIVKLPPNALCAYPWPDGVLAFEDARGEEFFAIAGEWNDQLIIVDRDGNTIANKEITPRELPESLPRIVDGASPYFSPDSLAGFKLDGVPYLALTLRHAGAVLIYDVSSAESPTCPTTVKVGQSEAGGADADGSTIRPEGVSAASDGRFIVTANEGESSVSLIVPAR